jgi:CheY-like chemotaxis protein
VVDQAIELIRAKARAKGIVLLSRLSPGVTTALVGDPTRLRQVLLNLLGNAVKFTDSGEVVLTVQDHESGKSGQIDFTVSDTGIGIPPEQLETIFDDFSQADSSMTRKYGGTGLGLGISRRLIERMGGRLTVTSAIEKGSTFRFTAQFGLAAENKRKVSTEMEDFDGRRVIVIDNNATNRQILRETLNTWGLDCDDFSAPRKALDEISLAMAGGRPYSLVIVDGAMPEMDGFEAVAEISKIAADLPVVLLTSDSKRGDAARRQQAGWLGFAVKPVTRAELLRLVCDAMKAPAKREPQPSAKTGPDERIEPANPMKILVVEDSADNRLLIQAYMNEGRAALIDLRRRWKGGG